MPDILVIGSANIDYSLGLAHLPAPGETVLAGDFSRVIGGKGANQAIAAARAGGSVTMVACVGEDGHGRTLRAALAAEGIATGHVSTADAPTGLAVVMTARGDNMIAVVPGANAMLQPAMLDPGMFANVRTVLCQLETPVETALQASRMARQTGGLFILDPAPACPLPSELLGNVNWLTPNESEARVLLGLPPGAIDPAAAAARLLAMGVANVLLKLGGRGSLLLQAGTGPVFIAPHEVRAIDTTAAGDAFNGAFAVALSEGASAPDAALFASAAAALAVTRRGAGAAMAFRPEIEGLLGACPGR